MKFLRRTIAAFLAFLSLFLLVYLLGPRPEPFAPDGQLASIGLSLPELEASLAAAEAAVPGLKPDNEARIVWADPDRKEKTRFVIVYLHGFGASHAEGRPVHSEVARRLGANLFLSRLKGHGIERDDAFADLTAASYLESAKAAVSVGKALGEKVILIGTSTGASLALYIASQNPDLAAVVAYSPLVDTPDGLLFLPRGPWGRQLVSRAKGDPAIIERPEPLNRYWSRAYPPEAYVALSSLVGATMLPEVFRQITCPVFVGTYYKSETEQDTVVSVPAILELFGQLGLPADQKRQVAFPEAGDHVIASELRSRDWEGVGRETVGFLESVLKN